MEWTSELHVNSTDQIVRDKIRKVTSLARGKQRGVLERAGLDIPDYLQDRKEKTMKKTEQLKQKHASKLKQNISNKKKLGKTEKQISKVRSDAVKDSNSKENGKKNGKQITNPSLKHVVKTLENTNMGDKQSKEEIPVKSKSHHLKSRHDELKIQKKQDGSDKLSIDCDQENENKSASTSKQVSIERKRKISTDVKNNKKPREQSDENFKAFEQNTASEVEDEDSKSSDGHNNNDDDKSADEEIKDHDEEDTESDREAQESDKEAKESDEEAEESDEEAKESDKEAKESDEEIEENDKQPEPSE